MDDHVYKWGLLIWLIAVLGFSGPSELLVLCVAEGGHLEVELAQPDGRCEDYDGDERLLEDCRLCSDLSYHTDTAMSAGSSANTVADSHWAHMCESSIPVGQLDVLLVSRKPDPPNDTQATSFLSSTILQI